MVNVERIGKKVETTDGKRNLKHASSNREEPLHTKYLSQDNLSPDSTLSQSIPNMDQK
jgi:hypothetical protein